MLPISLIITTVSALLDKIIPDKTKAAEAQLELTKLAMSGELQQITAQLEINKEEAKSESMFVAGWRPAVGWVCVVSFGYTYLLLPLFTFAYTTYTGHVLPVQPPVLFDGLYELLLGMLGIGGLRTFEKVRGVHTK